MSFAFVADQSIYTRFLQLALENCSILKSKCSNTMLNPSLNPLKAVLSLNTFFDSKGVFQRVVLGTVTNTSAFLSPEAVSESVVVLADEWLLQLPLEALKTFAVPQITSISRDFSLQFHYHRVHPAERSGKRLRKRYIHERIQVSSPICYRGRCNFEKRYIARFLCSFI